MKAILLFIKLQFLVCLATLAQTGIYDSLPDIKLNEVIIVSKPLINHQKQAKPLSSLDEYLESSTRVNMIKRGNYAWEPMVNSMSTERIVVTIDGMHIFGACTDKMDPITSYVDVSNLSEVTVSSGQQGSGNGPTIGGAIDLVRTKHDYCNPGWNGSFDIGFESNSKLNVYGTNLKYVHSRFFIDADFMYRDAGNYKAGKKQTVPFSQFTKYNFSSTLGVKINEKNTMAASFIYDNAKDVGYPALPMDVSKARALIASVQHLAENLSVGIDQWETKIYYNTIVHQMDDTKRPDVPIHMDMPGWSNTYGMYSKIKMLNGKHDIGVNLNSYYNQSKAEMTMYPKDVSENIMFMYTWPDVRTIYTGFHVSDKLNWDNRHTLHFSANAGFHRNHIADEFGLNSLSIFYPKMSASRNRFVFGTQAGYVYQKNRFEFNAGIGYGERAPSVSEGYGFYLFNSFDGYDYIGNPNLKNEKSLEFHTGVAYSSSKLKSGITSNYFYLMDYILGFHNPELSPMTIGASGVRAYHSIPSAHIANTELTVDYRPHPSWKTKAMLKYSIGKYSQNQNLPLIRPFSFRFSVAYKIKALELELSVDGAAKQKAYSQVFGEDMTPAYAVLNFSAGYMFAIEENRLFIRAGIENLADTYYSTFSDWNNIPRKGRNFYINVSFSFDKKKKSAE